MEQDEKEVLKDYLIEQYNLSEFTDELPKAGIDIVIKEFLKFKEAAELVLKTFNPDPNCWEMICSLDNFDMSAYDLVNHRNNVHVYYGSIHIFYSRTRDRLNISGRKFEKCFLTVDYLKPEDSETKISSSNMVHIQKEYIDMERELFGLVEKAYNIKIDHGSIIRYFNLS